LCSECDGRHVSVVIPTLNEALTISRVISEVRSILPYAEIVVVDGGSSDGTAEIARRADAAVITCERRGYGEAIIRGVNHSSREIVVMVDGDATYDLSSLRQMVSEASRGAVVVGCRFHSKPQGMSVLSFFGNWVLSKTINLFWGLRVVDSQSGLKVFPRSLGSTFKRRDMTFSSEVLIRAKQLGLPIKEVRIRDYRRRVKGSKSKLRKIPDGFSILCFVVLERLLGSGAGAREGSVRG